MALLCLAAGAGTKEEEEEDIVSYSCGLVRLTNVVLTDYTVTTRVQLQVG